VAITAELAADFAEGAERNTPETGSSLFPNSYRHGSVLGERLSKKRARHASRAERVAALADGLHAYNHQRAHSVLKDQSPGSSAPDPEVNPTICNRVN
jgi:transposase InsO family protein